MISSTDTRPDPLGLIDQLIDALAHPALNPPASSRDVASPSADTAKAAFRLAASLGACRMFGVPLPAELDGELPDDLIDAALEGLAHAIDAARDDADPELVGRRWDELGEFPDREAFIADLIHRRIQFQAAFVALHDAIVNQWDSADLESRLDRLNTIADKMDEDDARLQRPEMMEWLATIAERPYLSNLRGLLVGEFAETPPWFLDGTLERYAAELLGESVAEVTPSVEPTFTQRLAAATGTGNHLTVKTKQVWVAPDGSRVAVVHLPTGDLNQDDRLRMIFETLPDYQPATTLVGRQVAWAGQTVLIEQRPQSNLVAADFDPQTVFNFINQHGDLSALTVGGESWSLSQVVTS